MICFLHNDCGHILNIKIDYSVPFYLQPYETKSISVPGADTITMIVKLDRKSEAMKGKEYYQLIIETEYVFADISENAVFHITRERTPFALTASYDRLFVHLSDGMCVKETHRIVGEEKIKKMFSKHRGQDAFLDAVMSSPGLVAGTILIPIFLALFLGWKTGLIAFVVLLAFWVSTNVFGDLFVNGFLNKVLGTPNEKKEFYRYFESEFICQYYSGKERVPVYGEIETD